MSLPRIDGDDAVDNVWRYEAADRLDGDHMDDHSADDRRRYRNYFLPRQMIHQHIELNGFRRPPRRG